MDYFKELPLVVYPALDGTDTNVMLTNLLTRSAFLQEIVGNSALYYTYEVKDGETPEIIADKLYGDVKRFWIVTLFNQISNPFYEFPLIPEQLNDLISSKYGITAEVAASTIHHYEKRVKHTTLLNGVIQSSHEHIYTISAQEQGDNDIAIPHPSLPGTADTSVDGGSVTSSFGSGVTVVIQTVYHAVSIYTYEFEENEKRRTIKLLDKAYVVPVENEFRRLMRDGN